MKLTKKALLPTTILCGALAMATSGTVLAQHRHGHGHGHGHGGPRVHFGLVIGGPIWPHRYYPSPYYYPYYPPAVIAVPSSPPVYVEQGQQGAAEAQGERSSDAYWYYCEDAKAYYPYVKSCPGGWQRVSPQPQ